MVELTPSEISKAKQLGAAAFHRGEVCAPCLDREVMEMVKGPVGSSIPILKAWNAGWTDANLAAPLNL